MKENTKVIELKEGGLFPPLHKIGVFNGAPYLKSVFLGFTAPILNFWQFFFIIYFKPLVHAFGATLRLFIVLPILGLLGKLLSIEAEEVKDEGNIL